MLQTLARKPKTIAWFFVTLFYLQLVFIPVVTRANTRPSNNIPLYHANNRQSGATGQMPFELKAENEAPEKAPASEKTFKINSPAHVKGTVATGPTQPEMQSFQSVNSNNLVDPFTGDFSYNIPLLDVGGYPVNLHYQSGITMDQEASWVGLGWNINPGVISRNMRGLPDDFQGEKDIVEKTVAIKPNRTLGITIGANAELLGATKATKVIKDNGDTVKGRMVSLGASLGIFHNTYKGWGTEFGLNASINAGSVAKGPLSGGLSITNNSQDGLDISPSISYKLNKEDWKAKGNVTIGTNYNSRSGIQNLQLTGEVRRNTNDIKKQTGIEHTMALSFAKPSYTPTINVPYTTNAYSFTAKVGSELWAFHPNFYLRGYGSNQRVEDEDRTKKLPAYGYLYYDKAGKDRNVLLDFNREKDVPYTDNTPHIAVPIYTYDTWSISGEGTGGMFRAYRGDIGYVFDHALSSKSNSDKFSLDLGFQQVFHAGVDYNKVYATSKNNPWEAENYFLNSIPFKQQDTTFENVYFKNPGEKTAVNKRYLTSIGNDSLMRVSLSGFKNSPFTMTTRQTTLFKSGHPVATRLFDQNTLRTERDKRTQVISYLTATEAMYGGLDKNIRTYSINNFPNGSCTGNYQDLPRVDEDRRAHHLSEISVLNADGRRYIYGIPVYNKTQIDVTMATQTGNTGIGLVKYEAGKDNSVNNEQPKDGYYNQEVLPAYSHSFLLSGILSSDYVDLTGNGITDDDYGDAVKFNYSQIYSIAPGNNYKWRAPIYKDTAFYNEGLKTDSRDDRGSYTYGEREVWYLNSVESKTMMATFVLETDSIRQDAYGVVNENGGLDDSRKLYRLKEINLYSKADLLKNGISLAKPIKSVHFEYSYELCRKNPGSLSGNGKLTLKKVWFTYNKNSKGKRNPYVFTYNSLNPDHNTKSVDRWGNYKNSNYNPGKTGEVLSNADYPYSLQSRVKTWDADSAAKYAAPWTLSQIKLPSGGRLQVTYESDDYAYVQNRRAMQFFSIAGFGSDQNSAIVPRLYPAWGKGNDYPYVFINVPEAVSDAADIKHKYLDGVPQLFFKLAVKVPGDRWGKGYEFVPVYAEIESYGVKNNNTIWIRVKPVKDEESPFVTAALQFLRLNLYSKAYSYSEPGDNLDFRTLLMTFATIADNISNTINGFRNTTRGMNRCNNIEEDKSFVRLNNPYYKKLGGGLRVKKVELFDNWNKMTKQEESTYGQTYDYTTEIVINGDTTRISSGVATYEPMIGNDENPFRVPQKLYTVKVGALAPTDYMYTEEPFVETFFPAPMVGYSKIRVQTIHKDKKSANGYDVTEFYTAKDFPVIVEYTPIDDDSKKTYNPTISNFLKFDSRNYVTLSQGFKIELNDMHGKIKSQSSFSQTDSIVPISYTHNYYKLKNNTAGQPALSNTVAMIDSINGHIDTAAIMGMEVELMVDVREETSSTISGSLEVNVDFVHPWPPIILPSSIPLPSFETNRYRSIAILKIVNRYGILDSVHHIEKGSQVTTHNQLYDAETGDVLLSQTNNEFDDPVYNFNYPAHWAYKGMGPAYQKTGTVLKNVNFRRGIMKYPNTHRVPVDRYFESGDELLVYGKNKLSSGTNDPCDSASYYVFESTPKYTKVWAIDASKGKEGQKGIYFIDRDGIPYSADEAQIRIIRSGKRNLPGVSVGSVTSLQTPVQKVNSGYRIVFDSTTHVIAANAARFKDVWKVDSTTYAKDTTVVAKHKVAPESRTLHADGYYALQDYSGDGGDNHNVIPADTIGAFEASAFDNGNGSWDREVKSFLRFNMDQISQGSLITSATLRLYGSQTRPHVNNRESNMGWIERLSSAWVKDEVDNAATDEYKRYAYDYYWGNPEPVDEDTKVQISETAHGQDIYRNESLDITPMAQKMLHDRYTYNHPPVIRIRLDKPGSGFTLNRLAYNSINTPEQCPTQTLARSEAATPASPCWPAIELQYYPACANGSQPYYLAETPLGSDDPTPGGGYYCNLSPITTIVCRPNINDTAVNPYRLGLLGNWRMDRAYTYYGNRMQTDPAAATEIRTDGVIKDFAAYWTFNDNALMGAFTDTLRWVWNSELSRFNNKGYEIENHDPLDRYNAGIYGYNQTLPIAVAQNAKNREIAFDGFEDYGYSTDDCIKCVLNRHIDLSKDANLVDSVSHTGLYSRRINGNESGYATFNIGTPGEVKDVPEFSMKEDSVPLVKTAVHGDGNGLTARYASFYDYERGKWTTLRTGTMNVDFQSPQEDLCCVEDMQFYWNGYIQPRYTGLYTFYCTADNTMKAFITVNGTEKQLTEDSPVEIFEGHNANEAYPTKTVWLQAGEFYNFKVEGVQNNGDFQFKVEWESQGLQSQGREVVPKEYFYPEGTDAATVKNNTVVRDTTWCVKFKNPTGTNLTHKRFSPIQGQKVVVSAWVKQDQPCVSGKYDNAAISLSFNNNTGTSDFNFTPTGNIIEGWQRIEDTLTIPQGATSMGMYLRATSSTPVYFDDIRIVPFNGNMKSFVYNPINLRLMAELDENNYATFYEYDDEGTLIRLKKETERGIKTIKETRSVMLKE